MNKCERLVFKAGNHLYLTIETLEELCSARTTCQMSNAKYRRLAEELRDLARLLKTFMKYDTTQQVHTKINIRHKHPADML